MAKHCKIYQTEVEAKDKVKDNKPDADATLDDLLEQVTESNVHAEIDAGPPVGNEIW